MFLNNYILLLSVAFLSGCSVAAYTPVLATSTLGLNKTDLKHHLEYKAFIDRPFHLVSPSGISWKLKKFQGGRYYIEQFGTYDKRKAVCGLEDGSVVINEIFDDAINGGVFFAATVACNGQVFSAPLNHWSQSLQSSIRFTDEP